MNFRCGRCNAVHTASQMANHIHDNPSHQVVLAPSGEVIRCENCPTNVIKQLSLSLVHDSGLFLVCTSCLSRSVKLPLAQYLFTEGRSLKVYEVYERNKHTRPFLKLDIKPTKAQIEEERKRFMSQWFWVRLWQYLFGRREVKVESRYTPQQVENHLRSVWKQCEQAILKHNVLERAPESVTKSDPSPVQSPAPVPQPAPPPDLARAPTPALAPAPPEVQESSKPQVKEHTPPLNKFHTKSGLVPKKKLWAPLPFISNFKQFNELKRFAKFRLTPSDVYHDLQSYYKELCFHLSLEQAMIFDRLEGRTLEMSVLDGELYATLYIEKDSPQLKGLMDESMEQFGVMPLSSGMAVFTNVSGDQGTVWEWSIVDVDGDYGNAYEVFMKLCGWNEASEVPRDVGPNWDVIVGDTNTSRSLNAMESLENPEFIKLLIGCKTIEQKGPNEEQNGLKEQLEFFNDKLNIAQEKTVKYALENRVTLVKGPPGTGKTSTIHELILQLLKQNINKNKEKGPILVVAQSNVAIDNITEKLIANNVSVTRVVSISKEREYDGNHPLAKVCLHRMIYDELSPQLQQSYTDLKKFQLRKRDGTSQKLDNVKYGKLIGASATLRKQMLSKVEVICTTTVTCGGPLLKSLTHIPVVIMDESTQSSEAFTLIPMSLPGVEKFVFVGDDMQLGALSDLNYLRNSLFERLWSSKVIIKRHWLNVQYRMHPDISEWSSKACYKGKLINGVTKEQRTYPGVQTLVFLDTGDEPFEISRERGYGKVKQGCSYSNEREADLVISKLKEFTKQKGVLPQDVAVITSYAAQRDLITRMIQRDKDLNPRGEKIQVEVADEVTRTSSTNMTIAGIMVSSIDAFQGQERDFIIFSCVRSNEQKSIGFLTDIRRINVALTRARYGMVIIGNLGCLTKGSRSTWGNLDKHMKKKGFVTTCSIGNEF